MTHERHRILLVDDEPQVLKGLQRHLHEQAYEVVTTTNPYLALQMVLDEDIHLVVSDEVMPGMRGTELLAEIRRLRPEVVRMMLTGHADLDLIMNAVNHGEISRFFTKPCDPTELLLGIHQGLQVHDLLVEGRRLLGAYKQRKRPASTPGMQKDATGAFLVGPPEASDVSSLLADIRSELDSPD